MLKNRRNCDCIDVCLLYSYSILTDFPPHDISTSVKSVLENMVVYTNVLLICFVASFYSHCIRFSRRIIFRIPFHGVYTNVLPRCSHCLFIYIYNMFKYENYRYVICMQQHGLTSKQLHQLQCIRHVRDNMTLRCLISTNWLRIIFFDL